MEPTTYYNTRHFDLGALILRLVLGILILFHGVSKINGGIGVVHQTVADHGLPDILSYGVYVGEVVAPIMLILGLFTRVGAVIIVLNMLFALCLMHLSQLTSVNEQGGYALELQFMFLFTALAIAIMGGGRYAILKRYN